ncbi:MAG: phosphodiester glycosidase family protein [Leptolyngbyaceae cyanobacterium CSU_1_4]|nr:phosphodiester glycosidase family protein [Leptolyngbyaceae cyanobacterium CSU_1_4]
MKQPSIAETQPSPALHSPSWVPTLAQAAVPPIPLTRQGKQVVVNGQPLSIAWSDRQGSIGIADAGLVQGWGVSLLSTADAAKQPIEWFSDPQGQPLVLPTWLTEQYRYLDISELAQKFGWQVEAKGSSLQISTPAAQVKGIRQGKQAWGDRIVIDLDQPAPWRVAETNGSAVITIDAPSPPSLRNFRGGRGNRLQAFSVIGSAHKTVLNLGLPEGIRPRVWALTQPNRLLVDVRPDSMQPQDILWAPGLRWLQRTIAIEAARFPVVALEIDLRQPGVSLKPILSHSSTVVGLAPLQATAQRSKVAAAINAGFFNRNTQLPLGAIRQDDDWVSGPILNRGAIAWNSAGEATVGHLRLNETITTSSGQRFPVLYFNTGYVGAGVSRYTTGWGANYSTILDHEVLITVKNGQVVKQQQAIGAGKVSTPIPANGYLLVVRADREAALALGVGTAVQTETGTQPADFSQYTQIIGAGPLLVQNRQVVLDAASEQFATAFAQQAAARSVIASTATGTLMLVAVHNRLDGAGPTLKEAAQIMLELGAVNALNLDGGSSTTLYLGGQLLDRIPSTAARVNNGIGVFIRPSFE